MDTVAQLVETLGGTTAFARIIGKTPQAVTNMRARGSIPSEYWSAIVSAAPSRGVRGLTYERLATIATSKRAVPKPARSRRSSASVSAG